MMKKILQASVICSLCFFSHSVEAQFGKGDKLINLGIGVNSYYSGGIPLSSSFEFGVTDEISVGAGLDYLSYNYNIIGTKFGFTAIYIGARGSYHFNKLLKMTIEELDLYGGASLGFRSFTWRDNYNGTGLGNSYGSGAFFGIHVGVRYYFVPKVGAFLEAGAGGSSNARVGLALRL